MVTVQQIPLRIADSNVNPGQLFPGCFRRYYFGCMLLNYLIEPPIARIVVGLDLRIRAIVPARLLVGKLSCEIDKLHNHNFDSKLQEHNVTYLRFGSS